MPRKHVQSELSVSSLTACVPDVGTYNGFLACTDVVLLSVIDFSALAEETLFSVALLKTSD